LNKAIPEILPTSKSFAGKKNLGFSYTEILFASLIISVLLVVALKLFGNIARSTRDAAADDTAEQLALDMIREIKALPYEDPLVPGDTTIGLETGESSVSRATFDDIDDYDGWSASPPQQKDGTSLPQYSGFTRAVSVKFVSPSDFSKNQTANENFKKVTITVSRAGKIVTAHTYILPNLGTP